MEDEDSESRIVDNWSILDDLQYKSSVIDDTITHFNNISAYSDGIEEREDQCHTIFPQDPNNKNTDLNDKIVFKGFKKRILAQTQENQNTLQKSPIQENNSSNSSARIPKEKKEKAGKVNEYAQYLGLQPSPNFDHPAVNSLLQSESHNPQNSRPQKPSCNKCHSNFLSKKQSCTCSRMIPVQGVPSTSDSPSSQLSNKFKIQRKVYLCSACGTYFENWNLYLHMKDIHQRHLCLFCLGLFDHAERLSHHLMKNHSILENSFSSVEEFYQIFKGSCYLVCCSCEKVFTEKDNFYNHFCTSPQKVHVTKNVCSICRQVDGNHMSTCGFAPGSDSEVNPTPGSPEDIVSFKNKLSGKGGAKKIRRINRILNKSFVNHLNDFENKKSSAKLLESQNPVTRVEDETTSTKESVNPARDTVAETIMEVSRYTGEAENNEEKNKAPEEKTEPEVSSENLQKKYDSYTETIMEVSRVGVAEKSLISEEDDQDPSKSVSLNESTNTVSDEYKEDEIKSSNPKDEDDVRLTSPQDHNSDLNLDKSLETETDNNLQINSTSNSPVSSPNQSLFSPHQENEAIDSQSKEKTPEPPQRISDYQSFNTVTQTDRSLVIKICTNRNSQFSIAPRIVENSLNTESEENNNRESSASEEKSSERGRDSPGSFHLNECDSDSDSEKLAVVDSNTEEPENQDPTHPDPEEPDLSENADRPEETGERDPVDQAEDQTSNQECQNQSAYQNQMEQTAYGDQDKEVYQNQTEHQEGYQDRSGYVDCKMEIEKRNDQEIVESVENDGIVLAGEDIPYIELNVEDIPENMDPQDLLRKCIEAASSFCVYCNHARQIAVNGKQLGLHMLSEHRFQPQHPAVILQCEQVITKIKKSLDDLSSQCFNLDSYNSEKGTYNVPNSRTYECFHCRHYSAFHKDIYLHNRKMHQKTILICIMCKCTFYSYSELLCHLCPGVYSSNESIKYRCCMCPTTDLPSAFRLMVHLRKKHHACDVCLESTGNQQRLSNHVWKHKLHHLCYRCGIAYRNKPDITKHLFWKHGTESVLCKRCLQKKWPHVYHFCIPPTAFVCEECSLSFTKSVALKVHKRLHSGDSPYACTECTDKFISKKLLAKHEQKHKEPAIEVEKKDEKEIEPEKENPEPQHIDEEVKEPIKKVDVYDLPPLNLSSDSDSDPEDQEKEPEETQVLFQEEKEPKSEEVVQESVSQIDNIVDVELNEEEKKEEAQIMDGIWDNFKTYAASVGMQDAIPPKEPNTDIEFLKSVISADHDYCAVEKSEEKPAEPVKTGYEQEANKKKVSKKRKRNDSSSSSDSGSDSDSSSCSCGSNCSCSSSSGSSSSSSSSSDSDSSASEGSPKKKKKEKSKTESTEPKETTENGADEIIEPGEPPQPALRESDLETDESETDEEFYDENPQLLANKLLAEKRNQLLASVTPETSLPSLPPSNLPAAFTSQTFNPLGSQFPANQTFTEQSFADQTFADQSFANQTFADQTFAANEAPQNGYDSGRNQGKRKVKTKKRKKAEKGKKNQIVESIKLNIPRSFYENKPGPNSSPSVITVQPSRSSTPNFNSKLSSEAENTRSSKRKRIPKRFYGDSSDEENEKQIPKWRKVEPFSPIVKKIVTPPFSGTTLTLKRTATNYKVEERAPSPSESEEAVESSSDSDSEPEQRAQIHVPQHLPPNPVKTDNLYCYCQCPYDEVSEMIACDGSDCRIEWFHFECVGIMVPPKGKWYCPDCRKRLGIEDNYDEIANNQ